MSLSHYEQGPFHLPEQIQVIGAEVGGWPKRENIDKAPLFVTLRRVSGLRLWLASLACVSGLRLWLEVRHSFLSYFKVSTVSNR